jgi:aldehyde dehydrogenase (NAD+)
MTELNEAISRTPKWMQPVRVRTPPHLLGTRSRIQYEPRGVVLIMAAWNYPFALLFAPLIPAVAAGNCVVVRASEKVPHTSGIARRIIEDAFPREEVAMIGGDNAVAQRLLELPFDHIFFTGSTGVGRMIMAAAAPRLASVTLELGGKSPAIVDETADIPHAARCIMWGKFVNAGQTCVAPDYAFVHESRAEAFFEACRDVLASFYGGTDAERRASDDYCRMIDTGNWERVTSLLHASIAAGARLEAGGQADAGERYIAPTVLSHVTPQSPLMQDEIFGPVLPVLSYRTREEIYDYLHAHAKPLAMYVFSTNDAHVDETLSRTTAGGTVVNNCLILLANPRLPFGGVGDSGCGSYHGRFGFETFSHARAVLVQGGFSLGHLFQPPYARLRQGWIGSVLKLARRMRD